MLKKIFYSIAGITLMLGFTACSNDPSIDDHPKERMVVPKEVRTPDTNQKDNSGVNSDGNVDDTNAIEQMEELPYTEFDLEVKYGPNKKYSVEYEQKSGNGKYEAIVDDEINDRILQGMEAFQTVYVLLKDIELTGLSQEEVIQKVLAIFQLDKDYTEFDLDYMLKDGTKVDLEDKK
ncbi:YusW family protein [Bacillus sp. FSL K6-3431]|uniref:YusW family protein n=1 Tax=Bacillus sp. FSL K6-3431 TaxID=2921500 RepID=UPI0030F8E3B4